MWKSILNLISGTPAKPDLGKRSSKWPATRAAMLKIQPTCEACGGKQDLEVHHCVPFHHDASQELLASNLIVLCEAPSRNCHYCFGHAYSWRGWVPTVREDAATFLIKVQESKRLAA